MSSILTVHKQMAHEREHYAIKYDGKGRRRPSTLPPHHLKGARILPVRKREE